MLVLSLSPWVATPWTMPRDTDPGEGRFTRLRERLVEDLRDRGIRDARVLQAMRRVPRHRFVPDAEVEQAYDDGPLPIGFGQTISQPYIVAYMTQAVRPAPGDRVLEIGTGSGYQAAILALLAKEVYTIEIVPELAERSGALLRDLGFANVHPRRGDGWAGWPEEAPFDVIVVTAAPPEVPRALVDQLAAGGRLIIPVGTASQELRLIKKTADRVEEQRLIPVRFVPMTRARESP